MSDVKERAGQATSDGRGMGALGIRDYRLLLFNQVFDMTGDWIYFITVGWLIRDLGGGAFALGLNGMALALPTLLLSMVGGVVADRFNQRHVLIACSISNMATVLSVATLQLVGVLSLPLILLSSVIMGVANAVAVPTWNTLNIEIVGESLIRSATTLRMGVAQLTQMTGAMLGGALIAGVGPSLALYLNGFSFVAPVAALLGLQHRPTEHKEGSVGFGQEMRAGVRLLRVDPLTRSLFCLAAIPTMLMLPTLTLMPEFAGDVLELGPQGLGVLVASPAIGGFVGFGFLLASRSPRRPFLSIAVIGVIAGIVLLLFSVSRILALSVVLLICLGALQLVYRTSVITAALSLARPETRGRTFSWLVVGSSTQALGDIAIGSAAAGAGLPLTIGVSASLACVLVMAAGGYGSITVRPSRA